MAERLDASSLEATLATMRLERLDVFFLHTNICADDYEYLRYQNRRDRFATTWSLYVDRVVPAFEALKAQGRIGAWGITATGVPTADPGRPAPRAGAGRGAGREQRAGQPGRDAQLRRGGDAA